MKSGYVLLDGCADRPNPSLNYTTPLEAAYTPNLDGVAHASRLGSVVTVGRGVAPESDIAVFNMLGYSFDGGYPGRGVVEAVGAGLDFRNGDLALRANLASVAGKRIVDRRAGRNLSQEEASRLQDDLNTVKVPGAEIEFRATVSYRGVLVIKARQPLSAEITNTDPAYSKVGGFGAARRLTGTDAVLPSRPESARAGALLAAELVNEFTRRSAEVLSKSKTNAARVGEGKLPANCVLLRDAGDHVPALQPFEERHGVKGAAIVEMPAEVGIARLLGMRMLPVKDRSDLAEKARLFVGGVGEGRLVYVHIKGPDEFGHDSDPSGKKRCIEQVDMDFFSGVARLRGDVRLGVSCDHATPCTMGMHSSDPVPLLVSRGDSKGDGRRFTERGARSGSLGTLRGRDVLSRVLAP